MIFSFLIFPPLFSCQVFSVIIANLQNIWGFLGEFKNLYAPINDYLGLQRPEIPGSVFNELKYLKWHLMSIIGIHVDLWTQEGNTNTQPDVGNIQTHLGNTQTQVGNTNTQKDVGNIQKQLGNTQTQVGNTKTQTQVGNTQTQEGNTNTQTQVDNIQTQLGDTHT